jgi:hypothetical protein
MVRPRRLLLLAGAAAGAVAVLRHGHRAARGHQVPGGILIGDTAAVAPAGAPVLEGGCKAVGPLGQRRLHLGSGAGPGQRRPEMKLRRPSRKAKPASGDGFSSVCTYLRDGPCNRATRGLPVLGSGGFAAGDPW